MTVICGGGDSEARAGAEGVVYLGTAAISLALSRIPGLAWAVQLAPFLAPILFDVNTLCSIDPPDDPGFMGTDAVALISPIHPDKQAATERFRQLVLRFAWYQFCQCSTAATPAPPAAPTAPTGLPSLPGGSLPAGPCGTYDATASAQPINCRQPLIGSQAASGHPTCPDTTLTLVPIPTGAVSWQADQSITGTVDPGGDLLARILWYTSSAAVISGTFLANAAGGSTSETGAVPSNATQFFADTTFADGGSSLNLRLSFFCSGPGAVESPCCPPDEIATGMLSQILAAVAGVQEYVTLIQRQAVPFATVDGDSHLGLTGAGEIAVQGLVGVRVGLVDTMEGTVGATDGHPETLYNTGWIRWGDSAGWRERVMIDSETLLSTPYAAGAMTKIGYSLPPGAEIDIVEVVREP